MNHPSGDDTSRGRFLHNAPAASASTALASIGVAGTPAAVSAATQPWQPEWVALQAAAKKEGRLSVVGTSFQKWMQAAQSELGIEVDLQQQSNSDESANKVMAERQAGISSFDVILMTPITAFPRLRPIGALQPVRPLLFRPDVVNDKAWPAGFAFDDSAHRLGFPLCDFLNMPAINTTLVHPGEIKDARSLLDAKWKIVEAFRHEGTQASAWQIRDYVNPVKDFPGLNGLMNFTGATQRGTGAEGVIIVRWDETKGAFMPVSVAGGQPN